MASLRTGVAVAILAAVVCTGCSHGKATSDAAVAMPIPTQVMPSALFQSTRLWDVELTFARDQWAAMEPSRHEPTHRPIRGAEDWLRGREGERNGWASANGIEYHYVHAAIRLGDKQFRDVAVRYKGNASFVEQRGGATKRSFKIDLNEYVKGQKIAGVSTINLHSNAADPSWMNEPLAYRLYQDAGVEAPRTSYARLWITVSGESAHRYAGLYSIVENVDDDFLEAHFHFPVMRRGAAGERAGALLKPVTMEPFVDLGGEWSRYNQTYDPKDPLTAAAKARIIEFCQFVSHATEDDFAARIGSYVDLDQFARYLAVVVWINNWDSILWNGQNYYVFVPHDTGPFVFIPWDQDYSFDNYRSQQMPGTAAAGDIYKPWPRPVAFLGRMMAVPAFREQYLARLRELNTMVQRSDRFAAETTEIGGAIAAAIAEEPAASADPLRPPDLVDRRNGGKRDAVSFATARAASVAKQLRRSTFR